MEWYHVYLFTRLDALKEVSTMAAIFSGFLAFGFGVFSFGADDCGFGAKGAKRLKLGFCVSVFMLVCGTFVNVAIPTQKEAAAIYLLPKLAKSDFVKEAGQIPADAAKLMRLKLESWIADMEPAAKK